MTDQPRAVSAYEVGQKELLRALHHLVHARNTLSSEDDRSLVEDINKTITGVAVVLAIVNERVCEIEDSWKP